MTSRRIALLTVAALGAGLLLAPPAAAASKAPTNPRLWTARYDDAVSGEDEAKSVAVDPGNHNVYVTGYNTGATNNSNFITTAYSATGSRLWVAQYDGPRHLYDQALAVAVDPGNHNIYVTGSSAYSVSPAIRPSAIVTIGYDVTGTRLWVARNQVLRTTTPRLAIAVDPSNHDVYATATFDYGGYDTLAYAATGDLLWENQYTGTADARAATPTAIAVDPGNDNVYVTGEAVVGSEDDDYLTVAYDAAGAQLWVARYNYVATGGSVDVATSIAVDPGSHNLYVAGTSNGGATDSDFATVAYDATGTQLWAARYSRTGTSPDFVSSVAVDTHNHRIYVTGQTWDRASNYLTLAYSPAGTPLWAREFGAPAARNDAASSVAVDSINHDVYVTGSSIGSATGSDYLTVAYDASATRLWFARYNGPGNDDDAAAAVAVDEGNHNVYVTGYSTGAGTNQDFATIAYAAV